MKFRYLGNLLIGLSLVACQSARLPTVLPESTGYGRATISLPANDSAVAPPELSASLPVSNAEPPLRLTPPASPRLVAAPVAPRPTLTAAPDTALERLLRPDPVAKPDAVTTVVNVTGALSLLGGIGLLIAAANNDNGGYGGLGQLLLALPLLAIGIPLLFFQGKNGRLRKRREARIAAEHPGTKPAPSPEEANRPLHRLGLGMIIGGGLLLVLGLVGGFGGLLLAVFLGVPLAVVGAILLIAGS
ncbi:hypothetical protein KLP40_00485 [Hymenobacter sp. NST-14]|uniref:hypothetical protein n=1 Tax=Hymenobacter piscis TaxID=2839984 RepID=UPI001C02035A|nr:hypothetical protein [Hymenobacter piscis]MBT9391621.1 hypothetical protein [Hymenobacter piscis]